MANTIIGKVLSVGQTKTIVTKSGHPLLKRELVLDASRFDTMTGEKRENYPVFTFNSRNCVLLEGLRIGELVEVTFIIQGRSYEKDGVRKFINDVIGYRIEPHGASSQEESRQSVAQQVVPPYPVPLGIKNDPVPEENVPF